VASGPGFTAAPLIDAATVILVRDAPADGGVEVLMIQRVGRGAFGGFWVFPGGKVDPQDRVLVADIELASELATARMAAAREAQEETGLVVDPLAMAPLSHWMPPPTEARRFSTWFFVAPAPDGEITLSLGEATEHRWITPEAAMTLGIADFPLAPPTWMSLRQLCGAKSVDHLIATLRRATPPRMHTRVIAREPLTLAWAGDVAYEHLDDAVDATFDGARHRLAMHKSGWTFEQG
jgi:8-oxo-dGTP pyrophosphatase MutT (NUDIX family)